VQKKHFEQFYLKFLLLFRLYHFQMLDIKNIRSQFPFFKHHPELAYLDNAATTQKPDSVIQGIIDFYEKQNANIHRGIYDVADKATRQYEAVRQKVANHFQVSNPKNIVYTSGTTAAINLVAFSFLAPRLEKGDEVILSAMEHHANLIPWQQVCAAKEAKIRIIPVDEKGEMDLSALKEMLSEKVKMLAFTHISNTLGTINPVAKILEMAKPKNIPVLVDGAQGAAFHPLPLEDMDIDFYTCSAHKLFGPTGVGILYGKEKHLIKMSPLQYGGDMIREVKYESATFLPPPQRFEAGTTNIAGVIGMGHAMDFLKKINKSEANSHMSSLTEMATEKLLQINDLEIIGTAKNKSAIVSFSLKNAHPHDVATFLGTDDIAVRAGHHCTQPLMDYYNLPGTVRTSFSIYNTVEEVERLANAVEEVAQFFK